jgi:hypothetical protein
MLIPTVVTIFKNRSAELGDPKISLFVAKLDNPTFSCGVRKKIIIINKILTINPISFNISLIYSKNFNFIMIFKIIINFIIILQFQIFH